MYNIETLSNMTGLSRRTIRFYIQRGVLDPPEGAGRGAYYTEEHLKRCRQITNLSEQGVPIIHMRKVLDGEMEIPADDVHLKHLQPEAWDRAHMVPGVELHFRPGALSINDLERIHEFITSLTEGENDD